MHIEVMIAWAHPLAGAALARVLECDDEDSRIVCEVTDAAHAAAEVAARHPDVLLLDLEVPREQALMLLTQARAASPTTRTLLVCCDCTHAQVVEAIRFGAGGCILKTSEPPLLAKAVRTVHQGGTWYARGALLQALQAQLSISTARPITEEGKLTRREEEILHLIGRGLTNKEIGRQLDISDQTVKTHLHRVYAKLHQSGRYKAFLAQPNGRQTPSLGAP